MAIPVKMDQDFESAARILNLPDAVSAQQPATLAQLQSAVEGLAWKDGVRVRATTNVNLAAPGATIDGITMATNDRFLASGQTTGAENGIYIWNGAATPATRSLDMNTAAEVEQAVTTVEEGTSAGATFRQTVVNVTLGTTTLTWTSFGTSAPAATETTAGIAEIATQAETDTGTDDARFVTPLKLATWSGRKKSFSQTFGDGAATSYAITHNLGTKDITFDICETGGNERSILAEVRRTSVNQVTVLFASAPASNSLRITILA